MASIDSMTFDQASYTPGQVVTLTVDYTPDAPVGQVFTATAVITDSAGAQVATSSAPFTVVPAGSGDVVSVSDDSARPWAQVSDTGTVATTHSTTVGVATFNSTIHDNIVRAGLNYRF